MARGEISQVVVDQNGVPLHNASVTVRVRGTNALATVYSAETGGTTKANPVTTTYGRVEGWLEAGPYSLAVADSVSPARFTPYTQFLDVVPASLGGIPIRLVEQVPLLTAGPLPTLAQGAYDGMVVDFLADGTNRVIWRFRYNANGGTYKWEFIGGSPLYDLVVTEGSTTSTSFADTAGALGPAVTPPLTAEYMIEFGWGAAYQNVGGTWQGRLQDQSANPTQTTDSLSVSNNANSLLSGYYVQRKAWTGNTKMKMLHTASNNGSSYWRNRFISVRPVRAV